MGRGLVYLLTMAGVVVTLGIVLNVACALFGVPVGGGNFVMIVVMSALMGFAGSIIGLFLSKTIVKHQMKVQVITKPKNQAENWLVQTVALLAEKKGVKMPEVGIYDADEMNAFATGWNKDAALVAVSSGLLEHMEQNEIEAVLGHEMSHVSNDDMVTMCLVQGAVNTLAYLISFVIANALRANNRGSSFQIYMIQHLCIMVFGFLGNLAVLAFSRWREYRADAGSAQVLGKDAMIQALEALGRQTVEKKPDEVRAMCIFGVDSVSELFMTHPPLEKRIAALKKLRN